MLWTVISRIPSCKSKRIQDDDPGANRAQMEAGKLKVKYEDIRPSDLLDNLHSVMDKLTTDKGLQLTCDLDTSLPERLTGDGARLQQILVNLVNNAVKFTDAGGVAVRMAKCCMPVPGDPIKGYISLGRGTRVAVSLFGGKRRCRRSAAEPPKRQQRGVLGIPSPRSRSRVRGLRGQGKDRAGQSGRERFCLWRAIRRCRGCQARGGRLSPRCAL